MTDAEEDFRVQCSSKRLVCEAVQQYGLLLGKVLDRQSQISEELRSRALQDLQWNFETAVQKNVVINGDSWDDAPDDPVNDNDSKNLDDWLDRKILETALKRKQCPRKILPYVVRSLKSEREIMGLYRKTLKPEEFKKDPVQDMTMENVLDAAPVIAQQASNVDKCLKALLQKAEGFCQALNQQSKLESSNVYKEVFSRRAAPGDSSSGVRPGALEDTPPDSSTKAVNRHPMRKAAVEADLEGAYTSKSKRQIILAESIESEDLKGGESQSS